MHLKIAKEHLEKANPSMWDGTGSMPYDFRPGIFTYPMDNLMEINISFVLDDEDGWLHYCELREKETGQVLGTLHGYGIDSVQNLADTIECCGM